MIKNSKIRKKKKMEGSSFIHWMVFISVITIIFIILGYNIILSNSGSEQFLVSYVKTRSKLKQIGVIEDKVERRATLSLSPQKGNYKANDIFPVDILLDTSDYEVDGVDIFLKYDPQMLEISGKEGSRLRIGDALNNFMGARIDEANGLIKFSAISEMAKKFKGQGKLATVNFKSLKKGTANVYFVFEFGSTTDTNVGRKGEDFLKNVVNGEYIIK